MIVPGRHRPLAHDAWSELAVRAAIEEIAADAIAHFDPDRFWPGHPRRWDGTTVTPLSTGARPASSGRWIICIASVPSASPRIFALCCRSFWSGRSPTSKASSPTDYAKHGSLLRGDMGAALLAMRLAPTSSLADLVHTRAEANNGLPIRELMWGMPGSMLAAIHMAEMTREPRWRGLFEMQAARLLADLEDTPQGPLWTQDLYGQRDRWLGPVHGFAGNVIPLLRGWDWLTPAQQAQVAEFVPKTLAANAWRSEVGTKWGARSKREAAPKLCQHCHGRPAW